MAFCRANIRRNLGGRLSLSKALLLALGLLAGCSSESDQAAEKAARDASRAEEKGEKWARSEHTIDGDAQVRLTLNATNKIHPQDEVNAAKLAIGCGRESVLYLSVPPSANGNVKIAFDDAALTRQKWNAFSDGEAIGPIGHPAEKRLLAQMLKAKTFKFEFTLKDGSTQLATFNLVDLNSIFNHEPVCTSWS